MAHGNLTSPDKTTHCCPHRYAVELWGERTPSRWRPLPKRWGPGPAATVSSLASHPGPVGTTEVNRDARTMRASSHADQHRGDNTRGDEEVWPCA
jgi:hypothetical protein